jgi:peptidyl-dipeptidase A
MKRLVAAYGVSKMTFALAFLLLGVAIDAAEPGAGLRLRLRGGRQIQLYSESHALVIGASRYVEWPLLPGVRDDIVAVQKALEKNGFDVRTVEDPTAKALDEALNAFQRDYGQDPSARLLIYFAGHGHTLKSSEGRDLGGYIVAVDAPKPDHRGAFKEKAMSFAEIVLYAKELEAKHVLFVFDSCFSGSLLNISRAVPEHISEKTAKPVRQFITAGSADQTVLDTGLFRRHFVDGLNGDADTDSDSYVTASELGEFLQKKVTNYTRAAQTPQYGKILDPDLDKGDVVFEVPRAESQPLDAMHRLGDKPLTAITKPKAGGEPTLPEGDVDAFIQVAESQLAARNVAAQKVSWLQSTNITVDTQELAQEENEKLTSLGTDAGTKAARYRSLPDLTEEQRRKLDLLTLNLVTPAPAKPAATRELARLAADLESSYGSAKYCRVGQSGDACLDINEIANVIRTSRDPGALLEVWRGFHAAAAPMRDRYTRYVQLMNEGARELGHRDVGALWRAKYDMPPEAFTAEIDQLWRQVKPLYESLHCYVRWHLTKKYGEEIVSPGKPIPAHLLGNVWAQEWGNVYDLVTPPSPDRGYDVTAILKARKDIDVLEMVRIGERFYTSLGFNPLPKTFWDRSLFTIPRDRDVVCHASAWNVDDLDDLRIKMCIEKTEEDLSTIHHELGHNFYQRAYNRQPYLFKNSANDAFHEGIADAMALSITPSYLKQIGLIDKEPPAAADIALLLREALDKVAFLPFSIVVDKWRWGVFSGEITPANYNKAWWELRTKYQGVAPRDPRGEEFFDPGAKYHIPANVPYTRYFLARILQYQFHRGLCQTAKVQGALHRCSIYGSKEAGARIARMMEMGASRPWPEALEAITGQREMDASAIIDYFRPLKDWLDQQNSGQTCRW